MKNFYYKEKALKYKILLDCTSDWLMIKHKGKKLEDFFIDNRISNIAIYGYGTLGKMLYEELIGSEINIEYVIDRKSINSNLQNIKFIGINEVKYTDIDAVIITAIADYKIIDKRISKKTDAFVYSLCDVIDYIKVKGTD